eukprot:g8855.t1
MNVLRQCGACGLLLAFSLTCHAPVGMAGSKETFRLLVLSRLRSAAPALSLHDKTSGGGKKDKTGGGDSASQDSQQEDTPIASPNRKVSSPKATHAGYYCADCPQTRGSIKGYRYGCDECNMHLCSECFLERERNKDKSHDCVDAHGSKVPFKVYDRPIKKHQPTERQHTEPQPTERRPKRSARQPNETRTCRGRCHNLVPKSCTSIPTAAGSEYASELSSTEPTVWRSDSSAVWKSALVYN